MLDFAFYRPVGGHNSAGQPDRLAAAQIARMVNCAIDKERPATRLACRVIPLAGDLAEFFAVQNVQGAMRYNPSEGQGATSFGRDASTVLFSIGGRKIQISLAGRGVNTSGAVGDVGNGVLSNPDLHLVYWLQAENYAIAGDGASNTWIWNGTEPAFASPGYNNVDRENSYIPNGGTVMLYIHGRIADVVNSRAVLYGDILNQRDFATAKDLIRYIDQGYANTGQYFSPPTSMGAINAAAALPVQDNAHGMAEGYFHCDRGIFAINSNIFPRSTWSGTPMVTTAYMGAGATGPYAVAIYSGDQFFRSRAGVMSLRSARAENTRAGAPVKTVSQQVSDFLAGDSKRWLRFASVVTSHEWSRGFVTCYPMVAGRFRWHRGLVVCNFDPVPVENAPAIWEGLWTLPPEIGGVIQFIQGDFDGEDRVFAVCRSELDGRNRLVEFRDDLYDDVLEDGTRRRIRAQLTTRRLDALSPARKKTWASASLYFTDVRGRVDFGVWVRAFGAKQWTYWRGGYVDNCAGCSKDCALGEPPPWEGEIPLGTLENVAKDCKFKRTSKNLQFLVRWAGRCGVESVAINYDSKDPDADKFSAAGLAVKVEFCDRAFVEYSDYEYLEKSESDSWLQETQKNERI